MKKILFISLWCIFIIACKKDEKIPVTNELGYTPISNDIKDYCFFKEGSFWVYEDSITGAIDSMFVTDSYIGKDTITTQDNLGYTGIFDFFNVYVYSTKLGGEYLFWTHSSFWQTPYVKNIPRVYIKNMTVQTGYNETTLMFTNEYLNNNLLYTDAGGRINYLGLMNFNTGYFNFQNIKIYNNTINFTHMGHETKSCFTKNIGLVGLKIMPGGVDSVSYEANWRLKNYYIVQ